MMGIGYEMARGLAATIGGAAGLALATTAAAQCSSSPGPLVAATPAETRYVERYNALTARDPFLVEPHMAQGWRDLLADLAHDPAAAPALVARSEMMLAASSQDDGSIEEALAAARRALQLAEANGLAKTPLHAEILTVLSAKEANAGKSVDAAAHAETAMAEASVAFGPRSWSAGRAAAAAAVADVAVGRYADAEHVAAVAEDLASACLAADDPRLFNRMTAHAATLSMSGRPADALIETGKAATWASSHLRDSDIEMLQLLDHLGWELRLAGRLREAEEVLRRGVDLARRYHPDDFYERAGLLGKTANVLDAEGHTREAEVLWLEAGSYNRRIKDLSNPLIGSGELRRAADSAQSRGDLPLALARREQAVALMVQHAQPKHPELARARIEYAATLALAGRGGEARTVADPAIGLLRAGLAADDFKRMGAEVAYARIVTATDGAAAAWPIVTPVVRRMERTLLDAATSRGDLVTFAGSFSASFATATRLALATQRHDDAFRQLQLANFSDLVLVDTDIATRAAAASPAARDAIARLQRQVQDRQQLDRNHVRAVTAHDAARLASLDAALRDADAGIAATTRELDRVYPAFRRIGRPAPVALDAFKARLGADDILIAPLSTGAETLTVAVTREGLAWASTPVTAYRLKELIARIRASIDASRAGGRGRFDTAAARQLYQATIPPALAPLLRAHRHILYYASGALATIPPALLVERAARRAAAPAWLIRSHSITVLPTLDPPRMAGVTGAEFLGVGAPLLKGKPPRLYERGASVDLGEFGTTAADLPALPHAARELRAIAASFAAGDRQLLLGAAATERAVKTLPLDRAGTIAIATHGLLRDALPGLAEPALVLTPPATPDAVDDGLLTASEVANLRLDADWVILSACDTAAGSSPQDASYTGLARAFIEAGARALLVSHWAVRDDAAERLTVATVRAARRGVDRATALQRAMLALMRDRSVPGAANPAVWAPFVLVE